MSTGRNALDDALDRLVAAYRGAGLPPVRPAPPDIDAVLEQIRSEIAPLALPEELDRLWRRVDPASLTVAPYPAPTDPAFALRTWVSHRDELPGMTPRLLFPVAYQSHGFLFVELEDGSGSGGAVLEWGYAGSPFSVRFGSLAGYLDLLATMIELGELVQHDGPHPWTEFDPDRRWYDAQAVRLAATQPLPRLGRAREIDEDVRTWPEHWLAANGLTPDVRAPRGATTTVAALLGAAAQGRDASGTVHATVVRLAGSAEGSRAVVDDGTGELDLWCPAAVCTYGPTIRTAFELDVVVRAHPTPAPDWGPEQREVAQRALAHDVEGAMAMVAALSAQVFGTTASAQATAIRPLG